MKRRFNGRNLLYTFDYVFRTRHWNCRRLGQIHRTEGARLLIVEPVNDDGTVTGDPHAAVDLTQAGPGDLVYLVGSREASLALDPSFVPVDAAIVGIVDHVDTSTVGV